MASYTDLNIPRSTSTVTVKAMDLAAAGCSVPASWFFEPVLPGNDALRKLTIYAFLIEHPTQGRVLFDLGLRKDEAGFSPAIQAFGQQMRPNYGLAADDDAAGRLVAENVSLESVKAVIWRQVVFLMRVLGDMSTFPGSTDLVVGPGADLRTYPQYPEATLVESDTAGRTVTELSFKDTKLKIADLEAIDYFNDGSLYILNTPGHCLGHICALARTTSDSFVLLGGDICHHPGQLRPTTAIHKSYPCPFHILDSAHKNVSPAHFTPHDSNGQFDLAHRTTPMFEICAANRPEYLEARESLRKATALDASPDILTLAAHDTTVKGVIDEFPLSVNEWKEKGWKERVVWAFLEKESPAFIFEEE
ncbi:hypothetical protein CYLTODRAFT_402929 [Cylindrobasidium torrendii FP15055 ss-10]|uniref:Metallo-beta-lactamase domain-containing protein n=1 Tax=Cylindrobasidium torrendii FP15055 ss-10 TaxID=1314674 RepID=A0A0D7AZ32_9AGAR|nr:hypothetical protein CYLTODRAFT_402929 [Cylindrobasidium torrendii FP15055 ss-10]